MAPNIQVLLQVAALCCVVTISIGGVTDVQKGLTELLKEVKELKQQSQEEIKSLVAELNELKQQSLVKQQQSEEEVKSLHLKIEQLEKRLEQCVTKGLWNIRNIQIQNITKHLSISHNCY